MYAVILPCFNVAQPVKQVIENLQPFFEVIIAVDDGSSDDTRSVLESYDITVLSHEKNRGKGAAIRTAIEYLDPLQVDGVLLIDSDNQHNPKEAPLFIQAYEETHADMVIGYRTFSKMPWIRKITNTFSAWMTRNKLNIHVKDPLSGYRFISAPFLHTIEIESDRYELELELLFKAARMNKTIEWIPIETRYPVSQHHLHSLPLKDVWHQVHYFLSN